MRPPDGHAQEPRVVPKNVKVGHSDECPARFLQLNCFMEYRMHARRSAPQIRVCRDKKTLPLQHLASTEPSRADSLEKSNHPIAYQSAVTAFHEANDDTSARR